MREKTYFTANIRRDNMQSQDSEPDKDQESGESSYQASMSFIQRGKKRANENDRNVDNITTPNYATRRIIHKGKHNSVKKYCRLISDLQFHNVDEVSQRARHFIAMLKWSVVNYETFIKAGWNGKRRFNIISTPRIKIKSVSATFEQHPNNQLKSITTALWSLYDKGIIHSREISPASFISSPSESHVKIELWSKIFSAGSSRSDFAAVVNNQFDLQFPFFLVKFGNNGFEDSVVVVAEAVYEFNRLLSFIHHPTEEEQQSSLIYVHDDVLSFNLMGSDLEENVGNALRLTTYFRETVCTSGTLIRSLLNRQPVVTFNYDLMMALPELPREAIKSRELYTIVDESESNELDSSN
ncbi:24503_t:CDS:2 [Cetraspora pellucida]|uniref:24503_t:CDS:1 n=1 Tax=Cetraspora pellucida TaxID=1433469 RepID=A0A9N9HLU3_9GLOM|nr:24503_t:CDS:2 [Cetraspora pellucida]